MEKKILMQLFTDFSIQSGATYENRSIVDSDFDELADSIIKLHLEKTKDLHDENYELRTFYEDSIINGDR
ncbi:hypothetical protein [Sphingobacterium sp.]|uniref:hypothetical protein n=1 Tax=Sphingobacterium sp. TaxID=341027 RepID=UPI0028A2BE4D|nr:hypothetical protein [Sphingobacterium sp.]